MTASYDFLNASPVIPVIAIESLEHAIPLAEALVAGGIINLEVTLRTQYGLDAIRQISEHVPAANVGVGTVCSAKNLMRRSMQVRRLSCHRVNLMSSLSVLY